MDDSTKFWYDMILQRDVLTDLLLCNELSKHTIEAVMLYYECFTETMVDKNWDKLKQLWKNTNLKNCIDT